MTRQEHLQRCKDVAMKYVEAGELLEAVTSMMSDLDKHPDTRASAGGVMAMLGLMAMQQAQAGDLEAVVRYIQGFN